MMNLKMPDYIPGTCNIGTREIRRRQIVALIGAVLSLVTLIGMITSSAPRSARFGIIAPLAIASIGWVQSRKKFCLAYGFMGTFNFGKLGQISKAPDSPIAGPASPHAGGLGLVPVGGGLSQANARPGVVVKQFSRRPDKSWLSHC
jgi:hypothetical protein